MSQAQLLPTEHFSPSVTLHHGRPATTSLEVSRYFNKRHDHVVRSIRDLLDNCPKEFTAPNFGVSEYTDETGRTLPLFILHRDGFMLLVMGYTGKKALAVKLAYIEAFNRLEAELAAQREAALPEVPHFTITPSTTASRKPLRSLVNAWARISGQHQETLWPQVKAHFQLERIDDLPEEWIPDALEWVQGKIDQCGKALPTAVSTPALPDEQSRLPKTPAKRGRPPKYVSTSPYIPIEAVRLIDAAELELRVLNRYFNRRRNHIVHTMARAIAICVNGTPGQMALVDPIYDMVQSAATRPVPDEEIPKVCAEPKKWIQDVIPALAGVRS